MLAYDYWNASRSAKSFNVTEFVARDFARPLFAPHEFCDAWVSHTSGQEAAFGIDLPAYAVAVIVHSVVTGQPSCLDALTSPRGQLITAPFVLFTWYFVGLSLRRLAQRRWRPRSVRWTSRLCWNIALMPLPFGVLCLLFTPFALIFSRPATALHLAGAALWLLYLNLLAAERLRLWPFRRIA